MKEKPNDIKMLNVRNKNFYKIFVNPTISVNRKALKYLYDMITERQEILKKRLKGESPPWTDNKILKNYSFTNLRREDDRTSKWLIENISNNPELSLYERIVQTIVFRLYNKIETAEFFGLGKPIDWNNWDLVLEKYEENKKTRKLTDYYTHAFKIVSIKRMFMQRYNREIPSQLVVMSFGRELMNPHKNKEFKDYIMNFFTEDLSRNFSADKLYQRFLLFPGIGRFFAYQLFVDMTYIKECIVSENEFTVSGPGCDLGLNLLYKNKGDLNSEELLFYTRHNLERMLKTIDPEFSCNKLFDNIEDISERKFNVMSLENIFCEFSKYYNLKEGKYKRGRKYKKNK